MMGPGDRELSQVLFRRTLALGMLLACFAPGPGVHGAQDGGKPERPAKDEKKKDEGGEEKKDARKEPRRPSPSSTRNDRELLNKASAELLDLQEKIRAAEQEARSRREAAVARLTTIGDEKRALERTREALKHEVERGEKELAQKKEALAAREKEVARLRHEASTLAEPAKQFLNHAEKLVEAGIPWKIEERKKRIAEAREKATAADSNPAEWLAAIGRIEEEEEALGRLVEAGTVDLELENQYLPVQAIHLGLLGVIYAGEGQVVGYARKGERLEEGIAFLKGKPAAAEAARRALEMVRRERAPGIVNLELPPLARESEEPK